MKLTSKGRYAAMAMVDLASHGVDRPVSLAEISKRQGVSLSYLEQLFNKLRRSGLVRATRGPGGGYRLAAPANRIYLSEVMFAVDEPIRTNACPEGNGEGCQGKGQCVCHDMWKALGAHIHGFLSAVTLADVATGHSLEFVAAGAAAQTRAVSPAGRDMPARTYLDHNATSPMRSEAREKLQAALDAGNPSSVHREGQRARGTVETARIEVAGGLGAKPADIVFCSGATEALNLAIFTAVRAGRARLIASAVEHPAVHGAAAAHAGEVEICPVDGDGVIDLNRLCALLAKKGDETLVSVMAANNETGVIQPVAEVVTLARAVGAWVLIDAVQIAGRLPFDVSALGADLVAVSAHKLGGPMGAGALYVRPGLPVCAVIAGGGQEQGRSGGTENVPAIAGFGAAMKAAGNSQNAEAERLEALRNRLEAGLKALVPDAIIFGEAARRLPNTSTFAVPGQPAETLLIALDMAGIAVSSGSACSSGKVGASHVLSAMGVAPELGACAIRVSLGWSTVSGDIGRFEAAMAAIQRHRASSSAAA